jgi:hypothetical protein
MDLEGGGLSNLKSDSLDISYKEIATIYGMPCARQPQYIAAPKQIMAYMKYPE